jgi:hypothetical protein
MYPNITVKKIFAFQISLIVILVARIASAETNSSIVNNIKLLINVDIKGKYAIIILVSMFLNFKIARKNIGTNKNDINLLIFPNKYLLFNQNTVVIALTSLLIFHF